MNGLICKTLLYLAELKWQRRVMNVYDTEADTSISSLSVTQWADFV